MGEGDCVGLYERVGAVTWVVNAIKLKRGLNLSFAYCPIGEGPCFIALTGKKGGIDNLKPGIMGDVAVWCGGRCLDGEWCINLECKYNKVRDLPSLKLRKNFQKYGLKSIDDVQKIYDFLKGITSTLKAEGLDFSRGGIIAFEKPPFKIVKPKT